MSNPGVNRDPEPTDGQRAKKRADRAAAYEYVMWHFKMEVEHRDGIVAMHSRGAVGDAYRREIARLWRVALKAVKEAKR